MTKAGKPCTAAPLKDGDYCLAHSDAETRRSMQFVGGGPGSGRPRKPREVDVIRESIEARTGQIFAVLWDALGADRGLALNVKGGGMEIGYVPDFPTRIMAAKELLDRAYGRPMQPSEVITRDALAAAVEAWEQEADALERGDSGTAGGDPARAGSLTPA